MEKVLEGKSYPIDEILPRIKETVLTGPSAVLQAPPGSGKTTRTPLALCLDIRRALRKDLKGFWNSGYQQVKKELKGRYPKHPWPDDPWKAVPTRQAKPRKR